ncbi:hypothetical protein [Tissierella sp. Yu-01]|uniref:hypothetical protein n=1 Tax=Tissierella sp. Yu-01 TaxID=3035694 RepID=UPI00240E62C5|nr:hypothetical protein [Tissierella sp. Yu-01]WFA09962.1 hypothetical protein P3962_05265 [Tissierella sp. Yu-01]
MKLIKVGLIVISVILVLNFTGMLNDEASQKVNNVVDEFKTKINELEYKDKPITEMSLKELSTNISSDIIYLKEDVITDKGLVLTGKGIKTTINPTGKKVLIAEVDATESKAVESMEELLYSLTNKEIKIPEKILEKGNFTITVENINDEYNVSFDI